jgi:hypothetical protein
MDLRQLLRIWRIIRHLSWPRALSPKRLMTSQNSRFILATPTRTLFYGGRGAPSAVHQDRRQFTLVQHGTDLVWHRSVLVCAGQLVRIVTV